jgi:hypothetical protein
LKKEEENEETWSARPPSGVYRLRFGRRSFQQVVVVVQILSIIFMAATINHTLTLT